MAAALAQQIPPPAMTEKGCGFSCWQYSGERGYGGCRNSIEFDDIDSTDLREDGQFEADVRAGMAGWCIGHWDGQAHIVCPDDRESVWDPHPLGRDEKVLNAISDFAFRIQATPEQLKRRRLVDAGKIGKRHYRSQLTSQSTETLRRMLGHVDHRTMHGTVRSRVGRLIFADHLRLQRRITAILKQRGEPASAWVGG